MSHVTSSLFGLYVTLAATPRHLLIKIGPLESRGLCIGLQTVEGLLQRHTIL